MTPPPEYAVDVVIAVHSAERRVDRAAASILDHTKAPVRVSVVAHNIDPQLIRERLGSYANHPALRLLTLQDGIASPAGPMNHGFDQATAQYVSLLGSDDELEPGAIDSWLSVSRRTDADAVLARIRLADGRTDPYPPVRLCRHTLRLSGEADRLAYRSAPLGLVSRQRFHHLRLTEGLRSGEDLAYSLTVWFTGHHLAYDLRGPAYIVHGDAEDRVTSAVRPLSEDFAFLDALERMSWFGNTTSKVRRAVVVKLIRMHYFDSLRVHLSSEHELSSVQADFLRLLTQLELLAPGVEPLLSIADRRLLDALAAPTTSTDELLRLLNDRQNFPSMATLLPRNPFLLLHRQAPFRTLFAGAVNMRAKRRA